MNFDDQLKQAIQRGQDLGSSRKDSAEQEKLTREELKNLHNGFRLSLSDHIETSLKVLIEHFPGFEYETLYGPRGWGGAIARDDITRGVTGKSGSFFSRLEITVLPLNDFNVVNIAGKGTVHNKEVCTWNHYKDIADTKQAEFTAQIDAWILHYAEQFAAR